ncbi:hypothetical protein GG804_23415 [Sphingomonas histidinilytica]|jgi:hypothetical protein|uniref:hypothetical protein n=1 Tax=Rhizorhabdus histidinilytica TaxID=439228 RepID=UPI001115DCDE|nr:hypothetical protein [Rhizorhabdus histidinilytica]MBO9379726.1 hypothetical protein [Rhizorhabdus histidinilytica]
MMQTDRSTDMIAARPVRPKTTSRRSFLTGHQISKLDFDIMTRVSSWPAGLHRRRLSVPPENKAAFS